MIANALYAGLHSSEQCKHLLLGTHTDQKTSSKINHLGSINTTIQSFDRRDESQLTAQLNGIACLARLCGMEAENAPDCSACGPSPQPWYSLAQCRGTFEYAVGSIMHAFKVRQPTVMLPHCVWCLLLAVQRFLPGLVAQMLEEGLR